MRGAIGAEVAGLDRSAGRIDRNGDLNAAEAQNSLSNRWRHTTRCRHLLKGRDQQDDKEDREGGTQPYHRPSAYHLVKWRKSAKTPLFKRKSPANGRAQKREDRSDQAAA